jgi:hypothetical protein
MGVEMSMMATKLITVGLLFILIFISGFWLGRTGKPYSTLVITIHKLIGVATGVFLVLTAYQVHRANPLSVAGISATVVTVLFFLGLIVSGSLLSAERIFPEFITMIHKVSPYLAAISAAVTILIFPY